MKITFTNYTDATWTRGHLFARNQLGSLRLSSYPEDGFKLAGKYSSTTMEVTTEFLAEMGMTGDGGIMCCWVRGGDSFGVQIWFPLQILAMGDDPYYYTTKKNLHDLNGDWEVHRKQGGILHGFELQFSDCKINVAVKKHTHATLHLEVEINNL